MGDLLGSMTKSHIVCREVAKLGTIYVGKRSPKDSVKPYPRGVVIAALMDDIKVKELA